MALTPEQQAEIELRDAQDASRRAHERAMEELRSTNSLAGIQAQAQANAAAMTAQMDAQVALAAKQAKLEAVRLAKETLIENRRTKPAASAADITAQDILSFASVLESHINS